MPSAPDDPAVIVFEGDFPYAADFDPGGGTDEHTSNGLFDVFLSKFDSSGDFQWARTWGGNGGNHGYGVAVDSSGNIYATGCFAGTCDFDPGGGTDEHSSNGWSDVSLIKFDLSGDFQWARTWGGVNYDWGAGVAVDGSGNTYITGGFQDIVDFDPGGGTDERTSNGSVDIFLSKFPPDGNW